MTLDLAVHSWDLASGIGGDSGGYRVPDELAEDLLAVFTPVVQQWQGLGLFDPPLPDWDGAADPHTRLLGLLGRKS
jgi:hypothetical protein